MKSKARIRQVQLISPFGPGALYTNEDGLTFAISSIDSWTSENKTLDPIHDPRLARRLRVARFLQPPVGTNSRVPAWRFPRWHVCPRCGAMKQVSMTRMADVACDVCLAEGRKFAQPLRQVRFVVACEGGHLADFPWMEWVHESHAPTCKGPLRYWGSGGGDLASIRVECLAPQCGKKRTLRGITSGTSTMDTVLSKTLAETEGEYTCLGQLPWMGPDPTSASGAPRAEGCQNHIRASLLNSTSLYFPEVVPSVFIPTIADGPLEEVVFLLRTPENVAFRALYKSDGAAAIPALRERYPQVASASDEEIKGCFEAALSDQKGDPPTETQYRRQEHEALSVDRTHEDLVVRGARTTSPDALLDVFEPVRLVERLRETRVLVGFSRINAGSRDPALLGRAPDGGALDWLPAVQVYGEGIFLRLQEAKVQAWEQRPEVTARYAGLVQRSQTIISSMTDLTVTPRFVLVHTLAHVLINQLVYDCGYSSASLRERLYVSDDKHAPMAGVLIYTSSGDSEGTLGGLVRMGEPSAFAEVLRRALSAASWCSSDPVCMEAGDDPRGGQGPDSCNLAACHACSLLPETSCEQFNRFLDRAALVGAGDAGASKGFFSRELDVLA